ncbi:MAG TPA: hypothetical protein VJC18_08875, partial [bacterium]|nr:hypothetical protein [bacterium]
MCVALTTLKDITDTDEAFCTQMASVLARFTNHPNSRFLLSDSIDALQGLRIDEREKLIEEMFGYYRQILADIGVTLGLMELLDEPSDVATSRLREVRSNIHGLLFLGLNSLAGRLAYVNW